MFLIHKIKNLTVIKLAEQCNRQSQLLIRNYRLYFKLVITYFTLPILTSFRANSAGPRHPKHM